MFSILFYFIIYYIFILKKIYVNNRSLSSTSTIERLNYIDVRKLGNIYALDIRRVVKRYEGDNDTKIYIEREVYDRLNHYPNIMEFLGALEDSSIVLERGQVFRDRLSK